MPVHDVNISLSRVTTCPEQAHSRAEQHQHIRASITYWSLTALQTWRHSNSNSHCISSDVVLRVEFMTGSLSAKPTVLFQAKKLQPASFPRAQYTACI
jgi:hypothetical protein